MNNQYKYPTSYELKEIFSSIANRKFLNDFAQSKGVFITHCSQEQLAFELSNLFYDDADLEIIRAEAYKVANAHNLSGFVLKSSNDTFDLNVAYERLRNEGKFGVDVKVDRLSKLKDDEFDYRGGLEYIKKKPGRIEFLQDETHAFDFYLKDLGQGDWQVEVDCSRSTDAKELRDFFKKNLNMADLTLELIDQDKIGNEKTIHFFDELATSGLSQADWRFVDIKHLTVRRGRDEQEIGNESDENVEQEATEEELTGITQAILKGKNLRDDTFVRDCEKSGYRFSAMTYEFEQVKGPFIIALRAEFKGRPKVFEVGITDVQEKVGPTAIRKQSHLPIRDHRLIRSMFWNNAKNTFLSIQLKPAQSNSVTSASNAKKN